MIIQFDENLEIISTFDTPFDKKGIFRWQSDLKTCIEVIDTLASSEDKEEFQLWLLAAEKDERLFKKCFFLLKWNFDEILYSSLYFLLENLDNTDFSIEMKWSNVFILFINPAFSQKIRILLQENNFAQTLENKQKVIIPILKNIFLFDNVFLKKEENFFILQEIFKLFNVKKTKEENILKKFFQKNNEFFFEDYFFEMLYENHI